MGNSNSTPTTTSIGPTCNGCGRPDDDHGPPISQDMFERWQKDIRTLTQALLDGNLPLLTTRTSDVLIKEGSVVAVTIDYELVPHGYAVLEMYLASGAIITTTLCSFREPEDDKKNKSE